CQGQRQSLADRSRRREEAEVFTEMRGLVFRLLTPAATLSFGPGRLPGAHFRIYRIAGCGFNPRIHAAPSTTNPHPSPAIGRRRVICAGVLARARGAGALAVSVFLGATGNPAVPHLCLVDPGDSSDYTAFAGVSGVL